MVCPSHFLLDSLYYMKNRRKDAAPGGSFLLFLFFMYPAPEEQKQEKRTGRSILVNDISDGLQQRFVQRIAIFLLFFASHKNVGHMILLQQAQHFIRIGRGVHLFHILGADI